MGVREVREEVKGRRMKRDEDKEKRKYKKTDTNWEK